MGLATARPQIWSICSKIQGSTVLFFRLCTILFDYFRFAILALSVGQTNDPEPRRCLKVILHKCYVGDWFVLNQLSKNVTPYFWRSFLKELKEELKVRPKRYARKPLSSRLFSVHTNFQKNSFMFPFLPGQSPRPPRTVEQTLTPSPSSPRNSPRQTTYHSDNQSHLHHQSKLFLHSANLKVEVLQYPFLVRVYNSNRPVNQLN